MYHNCLTYHYGCEIFVQKSSKYVVKEPKGHLRAQQQHYRQYVNSNFNKTIKRGITIRQIFCHLFEFPIFGNSFTLLQIIKQMKLTIICAYLCWCEARRKQDFWGQKQPKIVPQNHEIAAWTYFTKFIDFGITLRGQIPTVDQNNNSLVIWFHNLRKKIR